MREQVGLPTKPFFYTVEQVADLLAVDIKTLENTILHFKGFGGTSGPDRLAATNLRTTDNPLWRIPEDELLRWLRRKRITLYRR